MSPINIYFAGAIRGGRNDAATYQIIVRLLSGYGTVLTEHVGDEILLLEEKALAESEIFTRDMQWLSMADLLVAEVSTPSLGVGYELAMAENLNIPVLCLFRKKNKALSAMIAGNPFFQAVVYKNSSELKDAVEIFLSEHRLI